MIRIKTSLDHKTIRLLIWLVLTVFVLFGYSLQSVAGSAYYSMDMENDATVDSPPVILQNGTAGTSTIYTNNTSAKVSVEAPLFDYVDNNETDLDSSADEGAHSNFTAQQAGPDSTYDSLTEEDTGAGEGGAIEDYVDNNTSDVDSSTDLGSHSNFENQKDKDSVYDTLSEENTGGTGTDVEDYVDNTSDIDGSPDIGNHSNFENQKARDTTYDTLTEGTVAVGDWGITETLPSSANVAPYRYMGGTSPDIEGMNITKIHIYCSTAGTMAVGVWTGGSLSDPIGAVKRTEAYNVSVVAGWNEIDVPDYSWPANTVTWIGWTCDGTVNVYASSSSSDSGDFQSANGRWSQTNPATADPTQPMNSTIGAGGFAAWWYVMYLEYDRPDSYQLDLEVQFTGLDFDEINEELCIYAGSTDAENITVDYWTGSGWSNLLTDLAPNTWNNVSVSLTSANFTIRFVDETPNNDTNQDSWQIDACLVHVWGNPQNWESDLEVQFTAFIDFLSTEKLCIYAGTLGSEDLKVDYWNGTGWENLATDLTANSWNNYTVSLTSPTFTIRFKDGTNVGDTTLDQWQIDASLLTVEGAGSKEDVVDQQSNVDGSADIGTHSSFSAQQAGPDSVYDALTEEDRGSWSIIYENSEESYSLTNQTSHNFNYSLQKGSGNDRLVVVTVSWEDAEASAIISSLTFGGTAMTKIADVTVGTGYSEYISLWYLLDLSLPSSPGSYNIAVTVNDTITREIYMAAAEYSGVKQSAPDDSDIDSNTATGSTSITITSAADGSVTVAGVGTGGTTEPSGNENNVVTIQSQLLSSSASGMGHNLDVSSGDITFGWNNLATREGMVGAVWQPATWVSDYELDLEVQWTDVPYSLPNEELCIYGGTMGTEDVKVDVWNGTGWENVFTDLSSGWNNVSITDWVTSSTFTIRFKGGTETGDSTQDTWQIDITLVHTWNEGGENYELDLEVQWTSADYTRTNEELCIKTGTFSGSENIQVRAWNTTGSSWHWLMNLTTSQWSNVSITSYLTSSNFTVQFLGGTETGDTSEDSWNIDATLLHVWTSQGPLDYVDNNTTDVDSSADKGTHGNFTAQEYPDGIYDTLTEAGTSTPDTSDNNVDSETITHGSTTGISGAQTTDGTTENMTESTIKKIGTDTSGTGNNLTLSFSHTLVSGTNRIVIVSIGIENGNTTDVDLVTYGGQTCTKAIDHLAQPPGNFRYLCEIWYILDADLPSDGLQTVNVTCSGIIYELEVNAYCAEYTGVTQSTPEATHGSNSTSSPVTNTISPSDDAWVISVAGSGNNGTDPTHNEGQVELIDFQDYSSRFTCAELRGASGETSLSTSFSGTINRLCRACASWTEAPTYQLDIEHVVNSIGEYENYNLTTRAYRTAPENFYLQLYNFTSTQWVNMSTITASSLTWYNTTIAKANFVNGTNQARIRYWQDFDATQETLYVDYSGVCGWNLTTNYELDLEVQWTGADYTKTNEELCIKTGTFSGSENIQVRAWNTTGSSWHWLMNLTTSQWSNVSITSYLTSSNFTVQFLGGTETGDTSEDSWNIDATLLHVSTVGTYDYVLRVNNTVTDSWQVRLKKYSDSNISRLQNCTIYFHNSTYGTSNQIIIENGAYINQTGPWYDLGDSETIYIAMTVQANSTATSHVYTYLEIRTPNTTTYAQYVITFEIT